MEERQQRQKRAQTMPGASLGPRWFFFSFVFMLTTYIGSKLRNPWHGDDWKWAQTMPDSLFGPQVSYFILFIVFFRPNWFFIPYIGSKWNTWWGDGREAAAAFRRLGLDMYFSLVQIYLYLQICPWNFNFKFMIMGWSNHKKLFLL